jgi:glycosyltransferase involved in cell wall biosynthesis
MIFDWNKEEFKAKLLHKWARLKNHRRNKLLQEKVTGLRANQERLSYNNNPRTTAIVQFFNKRQNISSIITSLRASGFEELIIIDDGSVDGSYEDWMRHLIRPNDFLLRCNDLFEVRTYDRAIRMARGEYVCLLQDDDILPAGSSWVSNALQLFSLFPKLLILGGRNGLDFMLPDPIPPDGSQAYRCDGDICGSPGINKHRIYEKPVFTEPTANLPFMFTTSVNRAPVFIRKQPFIDLGGINQDYAPFQFDDDEASVRAWLAGYQVGLYYCPCHRDIGVGGMRLYNSDRVERQAAINAKKFYETYFGIIEHGELQRKIDEANQLLLDH